MSAATQSLRGVRAKHSLFSLFSSSPFFPHASFSIPGDYPMALSINIPFTIPRHTLLRSKPFEPFQKVQPQIRPANHKSLFHLTPSHHSLPSNRSTRLRSQISGSEDLSSDGIVFQKTLRLVECSMFAAVSGLTYFLSNSLAVENYFGCFFALPIVITSIRWGVASGRKTMVATTMLLLVLSGPVKALTYLLMHGLLGFTMGTLWKLGMNWGFSVVLCAFVRAFGALGYVLISSFLIRENILDLITINIHTSLTFVITSLGINAVPSMETIYAIFGTLLMLNCGFFVFLLHILYGILFARLGMKSELNLPRWLEKAL